MPGEPAGWLSLALRWPSLLIFGLLDISLAVAILVLLRVSSNEDGFVTINSSNVTSLGFMSVPGKDSKASDGSLELGLLWTTLPSLVFALFSAYWGWIAGAISDRQPFVELRKAQGARAGDSILLDYRLSPSVWRWWVAFRKSHKTVGTTTLLSLMLAYIVAPFAARLFAVKVVPLARETSISYSTAFNESNLDDTLDWTPVLETVAATLVHHGNNIAWTDNQYAFQPFSSKTNIPKAATVETNGNAYSAYLNCELVQNYTLLLNMQESSEGTAKVDGNDRGCDFSVTFAVASEQKTYFKTKSVVTCSEIAYYSRLVFVAAEYSTSSSNKLDNLSVISCAVGYQQARGLLRVTSLGQYPIVQSFVATEKPDTTRPYLWRVIEQAIVSPVTFNPQAKWSTSAMGNLVLSYSQQLLPSNLIDPETLKISISDVFTAIYLNAVAMYGFDEAENATTETGKVLIPTTRLHVVTWVAYIVITFLVIALFSVIFVFAFVQRSPSILDEEPIGLVSMAAILHGGEVMDVASKIRKEVGFKGEVFKRAQEISQVFDKTWTARRDEEHGGWIIGRVRLNDVSRDRSVSDND